MAAEPMRPEEQTRLRAELNDLEALIGRTIKAAPSVPVSPDLKHRRDELRWRLSALAFNPAGAGALQAEIDDLDARMVRHLEADSHAHIYSDRMRRMEASSRLVEMTSPPEERHDRYLAEVDAMDAKLEVARARREQATAPLLRQPPVRVPVREPAPPTGSQTRPAHDALAEDDHEPYRTWEPTPGGIARPARDPFTEDDHARALRAGRAAMGRLAPGRAVSGYHTREPTPPPGGIARSVPPPPLPPSIVQGGRLLHDAAGPALPSLPGSDIAAVMLMTGTQFERYVAKLLQGRGFSGVKVVGGAGDGGVDILAAGPDGPVAVQCKRQAGKVSVQVVRQLIGSVNHEHRGREPMLVTTAVLTKSAAELARKASVQVIDSPRLAGWVSDARTAAARREASTRMQNAAQAGSVHLLPWRERRRARRKARAGRV
jgi:Restriction endonuclease